MKVRLSRQDMHRCKMLGYDTVKLCEMQGFPPRLENARQSREEANVLGFMAEFAIARLLDINPPDLNVTSDYGVDLWWNDVAIDVKFTNNASNGLIFDSMEKFKSDVAILCTAEADVVTVHGWMGRKEFGAISTSRDFGYGARLVVVQENLNPIEEFWKLMKQREFK